MHLSTDAATKLQCRDLKNVRNSIDRVTFSCGKRSYFRSSVKSIHILKYNSLRQVIGTESAPLDPAPPLDYAEVEVSFDEKDAETSGDVATVTLLCMP